MDPKLKLVLAVVAGIVIGAVLTTGALAMPLLLGAARFGGPSIQGGPMGERGVMMRGQAPFDGPPMMGQRGQGMMGQRGGQGAGCTGDPGGCEMAPQAPGSCPDCMGGQAPAPGACPTCPAPVTPES